jgi:hypothetical protein
MNIPLETPSVQPDLDGDRGARLVDAGQCDLFEALSAPAPESCEPPLALEVTSPAAPDTSPVPLTENAGEEPCEYATRSAVAALDEMSKANLRRLESALSWLQVEAEACRLPKAVQLPSVSGLPVVEAVIDRSTLERTVGRSPPLPAWLREQQTTPSFSPPPRRRGEFWPGVIKFLVACAIAAPVSYVVAVSTSPLHKRLVEIVGVGGSAPAAMLRPSTRHALEERDAVRVSMAAPDALPAEPPVAGGAPEPVVETPPLPKPRPPQVAMRAGSETAAGDTAAPGQEISAEATLTRTPPDQALPDQALPDHAIRDRPLSPQEALQATPVQPQSFASTTGVADARAAPAPPSADQGPSMAKKTVVPEEVKLLADRGRQFFDAGDLVAARILFLRAVNAGDAAAAVAMGATYDPVVLSERGVRGVAADLDKARSWYERAKEMGSPEGPRRLEMLANR